MVMAATSTETHPPDPDTRLHISMSAMTALIVDVHKPATSRKAEPVSTRFDPESRNRIATATTSRKRKRPTASL